MHKILPKSGCLLSFNNDFPQVFQSDKKLCKSTTYRHRIGDSSRQSTNWLLIEVVASCLQSSVIEYIVNHWSYITVNHLCKQLYKFHHFTVIFHETLFVISYDFPGLENGLTKFHDFPRPRETLPNALELASWFDEKTVKRYWVCTKTLFKTVVSDPFIYWVIN